jgi:glutamyl-tRNA reductase
MLSNLHIIAFTHHSVGVNAIGDFFIPEDLRNERLSSLKQNMSLGELMFVSTCNRSEFIYVSEEPITDDFLARFFSAAYPHWENEKITAAQKMASIFSGLKAVEHLFRVASSLDSMVVGEREIIAQVRKSYEFCHKEKLTGDLIRIAVKKTIETAKQIYTETAIARNPVSVVSLAYRKLKELNIKLDARFLIIGAGQTNTSMARFLKKHGYSNFSVFNRTLSHAQKLAGEIGGNALELNSLEGFKNGFDVIVTCTGSENIIITKEIYKTLINGDKSKKVVIDLAVPADFDESISNDNDINLITVNNLRVVADENLKERQKELASCENIIQQKLQEFTDVYTERQIELAMQQIPVKMKAISNEAMNKIFAKEINSLDSHSKEVLSKVVSYLEKKYIGEPIKAAKKILTEKVNG